MKYSIKKITTLFYALLLMTFSLNASISEQTKEITKSFLLSPDSYVEIENKYGDITIESWDIDSVRFEVIITARSQKEWNLEDMLQKIDVEFTSSSSFVLAETSWADNVSFFKKGAYDIKQGFGSEDKIQVDYKVYLPSWVPLDISNKFGNVFIGKHLGDLEVFVSYGDFRAREIENGKKIEVKYGKLKVKKIKYANIKLGACKSADIDEAEQLVIESSSSEIEISEVVQLNIRSKHDEIIIDEIEEFQGQLALSDLEIKELSKNMSANVKMGSLRIIETDVMAEKISIEANKADIFLGIDDLFDGRLNLDITNDPSMFEYPKSMTVLSTNVGDDKRLHIKGEMGSGLGPIVQITNTQGFVQIGN